MTEGNGEVKALPKGWVITKLDTVCEVVRGGSPRPMGNPKYFSGSIPFIKIADITKVKGKTIFDAETKVNEEGSKKSRLLPKGSLILSNSGTVCIPKFLGVEACIHDGFVSFLSLPDEISKEYLFYYFQYLRPYVIQKHKQGITQVNLNIEIVSDFDLRLPPANEQKRIIDKVEELFSDLEQGIKSLKIAQKQLKVYRQAVLKWAFEGKLTEAWRTQHQSTLKTGEALLAQIKAERESRYQQQLAEWETAVKEWEAIGNVGKKPSKPQTLKELSLIAKSEFSKLPQIPVNWSWAKIGNIARIGTGVTPLKKKNEYYENGNISWVTSGALNESYVRKASDFVTELALKETNLRIYPKHTLLVALYGEGKTRGKCSELLIESTTNQAIAAIIQDTVDGKIRPYLKCFLQKNYDEIRLKSSGGVQPNLNLSIVENTIFPLCSLEEQEQIVQEIESRLSICDQLEATIIENLQKAEALRQSILKQAFEGKLVPQDPNDEPAEKLLERIKAERQVNGNTGKKSKHSHQQLTL